MREHLVAALARATGCSRSAIRLRVRPPLEHQSNRLYDARAAGRHLIVKEYLKPEEFLTAPVREFRALELLAPLDVAPRPVCLEPEPGSGSGPLVVYEFLAGQMWDRRPPSAAELAALAQVWLAVQAVHPAGLWASRGHEATFTDIEVRMRAGLERYAAWADSEFPAGRRAADLGLAALERCHAVFRELADLPPVLAFCRSDARFANVIRRPDGRVGLVDWEDSGLRDPARDVADLLTHPNQEDLLSPDEWGAFLGPYLAGRAPLDPTLRDRTRLYLATFPFFWLAILLDRGVDRARDGRPVGWTINELPPAIRLRRYLARALAWPDADFSARLDALSDVEFFPAS